MTPEQQEFISTIKQLIDVLALFACLGFLAAIVGHLLDENTKYL